MPGNNFPTLGNVQNPFTMQVNGFAGYFTVDFNSTIFVGTGAFQIYSSTDPGTAIVIAPNAADGVNAQVLINCGVNGTGTQHGFSGFGYNCAGIFHLRKDGQFLSFFTAAPIFDQTHAFYDTNGTTAFINNPNVTNFSAKAQFGGGTASQDGSNGITGTLTTASLVGKTLTFKNGLITGFA